MDMSLDRSPRWASPQPRRDDWTPSPTIPRTYVPDEELLASEVLWLSLSLGLGVLYLVLRKYFPWTVVLRDLPIREARERAASKVQQRIPSVLESIWRTLTLDERTLIEQCGLDGYLTLRLIKFCFSCLLAMAVLSLVVLTPLYRTQERTAKCLHFCATVNSSTPVDAYRSECVCGFVDLCSLANVPSSSSALWATALSMAVITFWILWSLKIEYKEVVRIRHEYWSSKPCRLHSVFVDRIPRALAPVAKLKAFFEKLFPDQVHNVELLTPIEALKRIGQRRMRLVMLLERALVQKQEGRAFSSSRACCDVLQGKTSLFNLPTSVEELRRELAILNEQYAALKEKLSNPDEWELDENSRPRQAFVTFKEVTPAVTAAQALVQENMAIKMAPDPGDVRWDSLGERNTAFSHFVRKTLSRVILFVVVVFWGVITSFVGALKSSGALARQFEGLNEFLLEHPEVATWLDRMITLLYVIVIALGYPIIALSVKMEVRIAQSNVERAILERYFLFLVVQVFVFYSIAGLVFKSIVEIAQNPSHLFTTLATTIPQNASFFIGFIAVKTFWVMFDLVRGYNFIFGLLRRICFGRTVTERERHYQFCCCCWDFLFPSPVNLSSANANVLLVFFIATSYAVIQPLLTLAALIYFGAASLCFYVVLTTSSRQLFDGGGIFWTHTYWCVISSIVTAQLTLVGTLLVKQGFSQAVFVFALCVFTVVMSAHFNDKYRTPATEVTLEIASIIDNGKTEAPRVVEEILPNRVFLYDVVNMSLDSGQLENDNQDLEEQDRNSQVVHVFRYVHPALLENEHLEPAPRPRQIHKTTLYSRVATSGSSVAPSSIAAETDDGSVSADYTRLEDDTD